MVLLSMAVGFLHPKFAYNRKRYDLAYITPRLIASSMPTERLQQKLYRNSTKDLVTFLRERHGAHWHVWNLQEDSELGYKPEYFGSPEDTKPTTTVSRYPVLDHCPMPFAMLIEIVRDIETFLNEDESNVALIHCKCGKGRTGMVVAAFLMAKNGYKYEQAIREFTLKRIRLGVVDGVSIASQRRFLHYAEQYYALGEPPSLLRRGYIRLVAIIVRNPEYEEFTFRLRPLNSRSKEAEINHWDVIRKAHTVVLKPLSKESILPCDLLASFTVNARAGIAVPIGTTSFAFNTVFEERNASLTGPDYMPLTPISALHCDTGSPAASLESLDNDVHRFTCHWTMTEGICGTKLRGLRAFDSIEVLWKGLPDAPLAP